MATLKMVDGSTVNIKANTVAELKDAWQVAFQEGRLIVVGSPENPEAVVNPNHIVLVSQ